MLRVGTPQAITDADALDWRAFEALVQKIFEAKGYTCRHVGGKRDHGADIIATNDKGSTVIQVKHRSELKWVGERAVQAVVTAKPLYKCDRAVVVTNSTFAPGVKKVARAHRVSLFDREWLERELQSFCALCETYVSWRVRHWCAAHSDEYHGNTYCFEHQRRLDDLLRIA